MQPAVLLPVGVRLIARVDDRAIVRRGTGDLLVDVLGTLTDAVVHTFLRLKDFARTREDLARDEKRDELLG